MKRYLALAAMLAGLFLAVGLSCSSGGDGDGDSDGDVDGDADGDADGDGDADPCAGLELGCCNDACPCATAGDSCAYPEGLGRNGVCKASPVSGCWTDDACGYGRHCRGERICPCGADCIIEDAPGTCADNAGGCCGDGGSCATGYFCMAFSDAPTCHADLETPSCWEDADCPGGTCEGEALCNCLVDCLSQMGICSY